MVPPFNYLVPAFAVRFALMKEFNSDVRQADQAARFYSQKNKFVVPVDFSATSLQALAYAVRLAQLAEASITALAVVDLNFQSPPTIPAGCARLQEGLVKEAKANMALLLSACPHNVKIDSAVRLGLPWKVICDFADEIGSNLILIAKHSHHWWERPFSRHTADRVFENAHCLVQVLDPFFPGEALSIPENWLFLRRTNLTHSTLL